MDQLTPATVILGVLALFTLLGFLKSFAAFFFNLIALATGTLAGLWAYNNGFPIASRLFERPQPWMFVAIGIVAFVVTVVVIRKIFAFLSGKSSEDSQTRSGGFGIPGGVFGLLLGAGITYFLLTGVRYAGTMAEIERLTKYVGGQIDESSKNPFFAKLKKWLDDSKIGQWHQQIDFLNDPAESNAAKLTILREKDPGKFAQITAEEGHEIIYQALPVDPAIQEAYDRRNYQALLRNQPAREQLRETFSDEKLKGMNIEKALGLAQ